MEGKRMHSVNKKIQELIQTYAEEVHGGDIDAVSVSEVRGVIAVYLIAIQTRPIDDKTFIRTLGGVGDER
jgi:hypothetical protein